MCGAVTVGGQMMGVNAFCGGLGGRERSPNAFTRSPQRKRASKQGIHLFPEREHAWTPTQARVESTHEWVPLTDECVEPLARNERNDAFMRRRRPFMRCGEHKRVFRGRVNASGARKLASPGTHECVDATRDSQSAANVVTNSPRSMPSSVSPRSSRPIVSSGSHGQVISNGPAAPARRARRARS